MRIAFRTDASTMIGTGHVMRCLTLAGALRERGAHCTFICRRHPGHLLDAIREHGHEALSLPAPDRNFEVAELPTHAEWLGESWLIDAEQTRKALSQQSVDWLVVDHYALDLGWEQAMRPYCRKLMVIDDLADRQHDCDLLLDQNLGRAEQDYFYLLPAASSTAIGPQFALLRPEFELWREYSLKRRATQQLKNLLITMGGVDRGNATGAVLDALETCNLPNGLTITIVMGPHAPWLPEVQGRASEMPCPTRVLVGVTNMAQLMAESDLAIGAAGSTSWERCCMGLPTIQVVLAENQTAIADALAKRGAAILAVLDDVSVTLSQFFGMAENALQLHRMSQIARTLCDGRGVTEVAIRMLKRTL